MGGLLYKDFSAIRGRRLVTFLSVSTVLFLTLRLLFPCTGETAVPDIVDSLFVTAELAILMTGLFLVNSLGTKILAPDSKQTVHAYLSALPVKKETFVASKYVFIGIVSYVMFSLYVLWHVISVALMREGPFQDLSSLVTSIAISFFCLALFLSAVELPMFLLLGTGKAQMIKVAFFMALGILLIGYLLFGDLSVFATIDFGKIKEWAETNAFYLMLLQTLSPLLALVIYYASYRIAVNFYAKREAFDE